MGAPFCWFLCPPNLPPCWSPSSCEHSRNHGTSAWNCGTGTCCGRVQAAGPLRTELGSDAHAALPTSLYTQHNGHIDPLPEGPAPFSVWAPFPAAASSNNLGPPSSPGAQPRCLAEDRAIVGLAWVESPATGCSDPGGPWSPTVPSMHIDTEPGVFAPPVP